MLPWEKKDGNTESAFYRSSTIRLLLLRQTGHDGLKHSSGPIHESSPPVCSRHTIRTGSVTIPCCRFFDGVSYQRLRTRLPGCSSRGLNRIGTLTVSDHCTGFFPGCFSAIRSRRCHRAHVIVFPRRILGTGERDWLRNKPENPLLLAGREESDRLREFTTVLLEIRRIATETHRTLNCEIIRRRESARSTPRSSRKRRLREAVLSV